MSVNVDAVTLILLAVLAALVIGILAFASSVKVKAQRAQRHSALIRTTIIEYFRRSGVQVSVDCTRFDGSSRFTAVVESEPMKRFRLSHIIEMTVREHVRKTCGLELEKIYWRFPIKEAAQAVVAASTDTVAAKNGENGSGNHADTGAAPEKAEEISDEYINEGLEHYRHIPKPEVTELPWEHFEEVSTIGRDKKDPPANP